MLARSQDFLLAFNPDIPEWAYERARNDGMVVMKSDDENRVRAQVRLDLGAVFFPYVWRLVDAPVLGHMWRTCWQVVRSVVCEGNRCILRSSFVFISLTFAHPQL